MMASIVAWFAARGVSERTLKIAAIGIAFGLALLGFSWWLSGREKAAVDRHETGVQLEVQTKGRAADQSLTDRTARTNAAIEAAREEFDNATASLPPEGLSRRQRLDVCIELRDAGTDTSVIPQCSDLPARTEAGPVDRHPGQR